ncbi:hypothetical protein DUI87_02433 [Hirundo rustica rustica]|uniref:Uncharacterized protein n=1 Tax=Hirundo rustica rustica TaxID=333673 RepID=A0A3M0L989_HIRRU|nr:hypothetical protein DUI87_02433 [Hirundo rustica rustica]
MEPTQTGFPTPRNLQLILGVLVALSLSLPVDGWVVPQPKANVWATLAKVMNQDHICLSATSANNPLSTCLVGIPFKLNEFPQEILQKLRSANQVRSNYLSPEFRYNTVKGVTYPVKNPFAFWVQYLHGLLTLSSDPTDLELLGSVNASFCIKFVYTPPKGQEQNYRHVRPVNMPDDWCEDTVEVTRPTTFGGRSFALPKGTFFICGDRAWAGIPPLHVGGPCTLGRLSLFSPNKTTLANWQRKIASDSAVQKRDLKALEPDCDSEIIHWTKSKGVAVTIFLPWVAIAKSLGELAHLECWVEKQANLTSEALSNLLNEEEITRQATLQNWAAIDYLLLLHGHRCEEFEGLCCFNLTSRAEDVHATIQKMKEMVGNIKRETEDWLGGLFTNWGISGWVSSILKTVLLCLFILSLIILAFGLLKRMLYKLVSTPHSPTINHLVASLEDRREEEELDQEEVLEGAPEDEEGRNPEEEEHRLGYPTQHH